LGDLKIPMANTDILKFGDNTYALAKVLMIGASGPVVDIKKDDINDRRADAYRVTVVSKEPFTDNGPVIFYKQHGKFTILAGERTAEKAMNNPKFNGLLNGRLISSIALKKTRLESALA
jgi:hypothetical protein